MGSPSQRLLKGILSAFAILHILTIAILPNPDSILYREMSLLVTYGTFLGANTTWRFFSPNPNVRIIEYEVFTRGENGLEGETFQFPSVADRKNSAEIFNRKLTNAMFVTNVPQLHTALMRPYFCGLHPKAEQIAIHLKGKLFDSLEKSRLFDAERDDIGRSDKIYVTDLYCQDQHESN